MSNEEPKLRELFIEELAEIYGGGPEELIDQIRDKFYTTYACCEEGPTSCC